MSDSDENSLLAIKNNENPTTSEKQIKAKTIGKYQKSYTTFMEWRKKENISTLSEEVLLAYFQDMSIKKLPTSLWAEASKIKSSLNIFEKTDISKYTKLYTFLKQNSEGYKAKQAKTFTLSEIKTFIREAPDEVYLLLKVAVIFGVVGACRRQELHNLQFQNVTDFSGILFVNVMKANKLERTFSVTAEYYDIVKRYMALRPAECQTKHFFVNYSKGKCSKQQHVGINAFGSMGKAVAKYLKLKNSELYTGHCFKRTSATLLINTDGADVDRYIQNKKLERQPGSSHKSEGLRRFSSDRQGM